MYKSKLQILCQRNTWSLPDFTTTKCGLDHNPTFSASVTVNGVPFHTTDLSRTSKEAQNKAAKVALDHFSSPNSNPNQNPYFPQPSLVAAALPTASVSVSSASNQNSDVGLFVGGISQPTMVETMRTPWMNDTLFGVKDDKKFVDMRHLYKNRLQSYAQKRSLQLPEYSSEREGPLHANRFKSKVTIEGETYGSPDFFPTIKEAEHAAAKVALESLSANEVQEDDSGLYKNLLQELAQRRGLNVPKYDTKVSGPAHMPTFLSTVEIGGQSFEGQEAKSKKQAETNAAKVAYIDLQEHNGLVTSGRASLDPTFLPSGYQIKEALEESASILQAVISGDLQQSTGPKADPMIFGEQNEEDRGDVFTGDLQQSAEPKANLVIREDRDEEYKAGHREKLSSNSAISNPQVHNPHSPPPPLDTDTNSKRPRCSTSADSIYAMLRDPFPSSSSSTEDRVSPPSVHSETFNNYSILDSRNETPLGAANGMNALTSEKIFVYPCMPNMKLPDGAAVLPFSDDKWVAVKMGSSK